MDLSQRELTEQVEAWTTGWSTGLKKELDARDERLSKQIARELATRAEQEHEAVSALEEQLWLTDKRLGARIDDARALVKASTHGSHRTAPTDNAIGVGKQQGSPSEEADRRGSAGSLLAAAVEAMEESSGLGRKSQPRRAWRGRLAVGSDLDDVVASPRASPLSSIVGSSRRPLPSSVDPDRAALPLRSHRGALLAVEGLAEALLDETSETSDR